MASIFADFWCCHLCGRICNVGIHDLCINFNCQHEKCELCTIRFSSPRHRQDTELETSFHPEPDRASESSTDPLGSNEDRIDALLSIAKQVLEAGTLPEYTADPTDPSLKSLKVELASFKILLTELIHRAKKAPRDETLSVVVDYLAGPKGPLIELELAMFMVIPEYDPITVANVKVSTALGQIERSKNLINIAFQKDVSELAQAITNDTPFYFLTRWNIEEDFIWRIFNAAPRANMLESPHEGPTLPAVTTPIPSVVRRLNTPSVVGIGEGRRLKREWSSRQRMYSGSQPSPSTGRSSLPIADSQEVSGVSLKQEIKGKPRIQSLKPFPTRTHLSPLLQAEIESNPPYQPFHTDCRVSLQEYTSDCDYDKPCSTNATWVFGGEIPSRKLFVGALRSEEEDVLLKETQPVSILSKTNDAAKEISVRTHRNEKNRIENVPLWQAAMDGGIGTEAASITSDVDSVFSGDISVSSASTAELDKSDREFASEVAKALLEHHEMSRLIRSLAKSGLLEANLERERMRFFKAMREYAKDLQNVAQSPVDTLVANYVRRRYRLIAGTMERPQDQAPKTPFGQWFSLKELDSLIENRVTSMGRVPDYLKNLPNYIGDNNLRAEDAIVDRMPDDNQSESEDSANDNERPGLFEGRGSRLPHITQAKKFLLDSAPFTTLLSAIQELLHRLDESTLKENMVKKETVGVPRNETQESDDRVDYETLGDRSTSARTERQQFSSELTSLSLGEIQVLDHTNMSFFGKMRGWVEDYSGESWNWWPLPPYQPILMPECVRIQWICPCGETRWVDLPKELASNYLQLLHDKATSTSNANQAPLKHGSPASTESGTSSTQAAAVKDLGQNSLRINSTQIFLGGVALFKSIYQLLLMPLVKNKTLEELDLMFSIPTSETVLASIRKMIYNLTHLGFFAATQNTGRTPIPSTSTASSGSSVANTNSSSSVASSSSLNPKPASIPGPSSYSSSTPAPGQKGRRLSSPTLKSLYVLFCAYRGRKLRYTRLEVSKHNDDDFFKDLRKEYRKMRGWWRYWLNPRQFDHCDFVKFTRFYVDELARIGHGLPHDASYQYNPRPPGDHDDPPIVPHEFYRRFYHVRNTCRSCPKDEALIRIPKRTLMFQINVHVGGREDMWGLHAETRPAFWMVAAYMLAILSGSFVFWGWWMSRHAGDWQNAAVPFSATLGCMAMLFLPLNEKFKAS